MYRHVGWIIRATLQNDVVITLENLHMNKQKAEEVLATVSAPDMVSKEIVEVYDFKPLPYVEPKDVTYIEP